MSVDRFVRWIAATLLAAGLSACMQESTATFDLSAAAPKHEATRRAEIRVRSPNVPEALDGYRLVSRSDAGAYTPIAGAQWSDRLPDLIAARAADSLSAAGLNAFGEGGPATANYDLLLEVHAFDYDAGKQRVEIAIAAEIVALMTGRTLARQEFAATQPVASGDPKLVAAAFARTFSGVMADIADFVAKKA